MLNLRLTRRFWKIFSTTWLWKISVWQLDYLHILAAGKLRSIDSNWLKGYSNNNTINVRISFDGYGSKMQKVSGCRPTVSNETILATKQEFFFTKVAPVQSVTDIALFSVPILRHKLRFSHVKVFLTIMEDSYCSPESLFHPALPFIFS